MSDPRAGSRKGMRDGFSTPGEYPEGMWEWEQGAWERGRARAKECGGVSERSGGDRVGMEGDVDVGRGSAPERCRKRNIKFMTMV